MESKIMNEAKSNALKYQTTLSLNPTHNSSIHILPEKQVIAEKPMGNLHRLEVQAYRKK
jgi:hypothetical protein